MQPSKWTPPLLTPQYRLTSCTFQTPLLFIFGFFHMYLAPSLCIWPLLRVFGLSYVYLASNLCIWRLLFILGLIYLNLAMLPLHTALKFNLATYLVLSWNLLLSNYQNIISKKNQQYTVIKFSISYHEMITNFSGGIACAGRGKCTDKWWKTR